MSAEEVLGTTGVARRPVDATESQRASRAWWDADADDYLAAHGGDIGEVDFVWCPEGLREADARLLGELADRRVLEIGCGSAPCARWLAAHGAAPFALDLSGRMLRHAAQLNAATGVNIPLLQAGAERLPFADASFDLAFCVATLHHALDLRAMVGELARVTRPAGTVAALNEGTRAPYRSGKNPEQEHEKELGINEHVHTMWAYLWAFARAGLRPLRLEYAEGPAELASRKIAGKLLRICELPATLWALNAYPYAGLSLFARRRRA
jgi:SAM-dependent methyltransferase